MRKNAQLPRTSRVNEKIIEYYLKFGQDRDLEKYMRLYSPCGSRSDCKSRSSTTTNSSCRSEDEGRSMRRLFHQEMDTTIESDCEPKEFIVPIKMQTNNTIGKKSKADECTSSAPDLHTPPPSNHRKGQTKQTQTPESIAKSHRRLEWDSLGDVGYKKSLSTSNISILERSVLKEYFQEISSISSSKKETNTVECSKKTKKPVDEQIQTQKQEKNSKPHIPESTTPPLASSTMMQLEKGKSNKSLPKLVSRSTSMSLQKRYDQYAQTSTYVPPQHISREVQVTLSNTPSVTSSTAAGTATPSSFDYYSSRSGRSTTDEEKRFKKSALKIVHQNVVKSKVSEESVHPFVAEINEMLSSCKIADSRKRSTKQESIVADLQKVHDTLKKALSENKENSSSTSSIVNSPQLDLGIQLLCSLIDARSLSQKQKKRLVRDIVKRISTLNADDEDDAAEIAVAHISDALTTQMEKCETRKNENENMEATPQTSSAVTVARTGKTTMDMSEIVSNLPSSTSSEGHDERLMRVDVLKKSSLPTTSAKARAQLATENTENVQKLHIPHTRISAGTQVEEADVSQPKYSSMQEIPESAETQKKSLPNEPVNVNKGTDKDSSASKASSTSKDVTTQKALINIESGGASDTDVDVAAHSTMREWLNPMTQSEIEYEQKKLEMAKVAVKRNKLAKCFASEKIEPERKSQLQWIQSEIERLETLRCLLLKPNIERENFLEMHESIPLNVEKLYDTVFTDTKLASTTSSTTTSAHSSGNDNAMQEIEVIIEESNEDVVKLDEKTKSTKQRKRETQIIYDKPVETINTYDNLVPGKALFRTMTETVTTKEEQVLPAAVKLTAESAAISAPPKQLASAKQRQQQRSKIDTPSGDSNDGESVGSFAQQRKREFLEQYRMKKRSHYESLLHQQQQMLIQQQQQIIHELQQRCNTITHTTAAPTYSVPRNMPPNAYCQCASTQHPAYHQAYFHQQHNNMCTAQARTNIKCSQPAQPPCPPPCPPRVQSQQGAAINYSHKTQTIHSEQSTSSIFCISSEVSIPMGSSSTTSSTTTTTHQYDDVAAVTTAAPGVAIQTGDSLRRSQPIFGRRIQYNSAHMNVPQYFAYNPQPVCSGQSICVQVKPKAIAYVIQFEKKTTSSTTTTTTTTTSATSIASNQFTPHPSSESNDLLREDAEACALQDYLVRAKPQFIAHTKERKAILNQIQMLRQERGKELRDIIENASENSLETRLQHLPPPATKRLRIFATKEMKAMTQRHCENLPEVLKQRERKREERRRQGNRLIRDLFNQRLQRRVRTGKLSLNHSKTVI
ncbi:Alstrom syndrome protein 1 homolog a-like [Bactrocera tryoni]|uniref:Alstrom syndrome protein 1 homolog a-like n=1 Tax=Bactrocera tryoni TaxID=59916 RepID=UPI001A99B774|nr:Alstrom syndrome protein 1 homolog a-like [Bactrocera tryoni]